MKPYIQYLLDHEKKYGFRAKLAQEPTKEELDKLQKVLARWNLEAISEPKRLPVSEDHTGFGHLKATDLYIIDMVVNYPISPLEMQAAIHEATGISLSRIMVVTPNQEVLAAPIAPEAEGRAILDTPLPTQKAPQLLADLANALKVKTIEHQFAVKPEVGKTTNDIPQSNTSPVGTTKNKLPERPRTGRA
ncbi:hypothetical protein EB001_02610 [bacterium]|nr:hypothetical protein [bacterium]